uniref:Ubiquitin carboxyl-terminal hydrolase n=1 Tax=Caenorhabditis tropicalis TaxID=1561998 RepID=A0A1I7UG56_9PELO
MSFFSKQFAVSSKDLYSLQWFLSFRMSYSNRESNTSLRYRSGSVERRSTTSSTPSSSSRDPAPYRTSYGTERGRSRDLPSSTTRMSRATSYDPFASSNRSSSVIRNGGGSLSNSDYTPRISSYTSRYGSTEQLNSSSYRPSSYRSGSITSGTGSSTGATSSSYTPRNVRAGSVSIGVAKRFESSKSEADDDSISEEDEDDILSKYQTKGLRRASSATSITPRASVCNSPRAEVNCKIRISISVSRNETFDEKFPNGSHFWNFYEKEDPETEEKKMEEDKKPIISIPKDVPKLVDMSSDEEEEEESAEEEEKEKIPMPSEIQNISEPIKKVVSSIKINGIPVKEEAKETKKEDVGPVRIRIRSDKSPSRTREIPMTDETPKSPENLIKSAVKVVLNQEEPKNKTNESRELSEEKSSESDTTTTSSRASTLRKRRDPNRTLENLQSILKAEKMNEEKKEEEIMRKEEEAENGEQEKRVRRIPIPLVLITEPSNPSTPLATTPVTTAASICLWNNNEVNKKRTSSSTEDDEEYDEEEDYSSGDWTEGEDDEEYITDEEEEDNEFSVSQTFSLKDHINLRELYPLATSASNTSALVSEFSDGDTFLADARKEESRGRVDSLFAIPAPTFTCSVTYDGMIPGDEDEWSDEVHSCEEGDDDDFRILPIARPGSSSLGAYMSPGSMTSDDESGSNYDGRTVGCTLKLVDRAARKDSEESDESEYYDDEEEMEDEYEDEEYWDEEIEYDDEEEEEYEYEDEEELEEYVDEEEEGEENEETMKSVESSEEEEEMSMMESESHELFVTPPIKLMTESFVEEMIEEASYGEIPEETLFALDEVEVEDYTGQKDVHLIPTFVRQMTEDIREESTSRFASDRKPATDFAKKAVIQPTKLEKVQVGTKIDTKLAPSEEEKKRMKEEEERKKEKKKRRRKEKKRN